MFPMVLLPPGWAMVQPPQPRPAGRHDRAAPVIQFEDVFAYDDDDDTDTTYSTTDSEDAVLLNIIAELPSPPERRPVPATLAEAVQRTSAMRSPPADTFCSVCQVGVLPGGAPWRQLPCGHAFHDECALLALARSRRCPLCRHDILDDVSVTPPSAPSIAPPAAHPPETPPRRASLRSHRRAP